MSKAKFNAFCGGGARSSKAGANSPEATRKIYAKRCGKFTPSDKANLSQMARQIQGKKLSQI
ncbi:hypothetical protein BS377_01555 [Campylobacter upsaliensis]|nr:hypothetical protein [Campylobacter upsaliensis]